MMLAGMITEVLLYLCFSILMGSFLMYLIPSPFRPEIHVPKGILMAASGGIAIFSFVPVLQVVLHLYHEIGLERTFQAVVFTFEVGKAWIFTYILSNLLFIYIIWFDYRKFRRYSLIGLIFVLFLALSLGWSSHAGSLDQVKGFIAHTLHFISVCLWVGVLIIAGWFSKNDENWARFLKWFTPLAMGCFATVILTGFVLMTLIVDFQDYTNAWILSYGQALLIKHLLIIPLMVYAFMNGFLIKKKLNAHTDFNPIPWTKAESMVILLIFSATAVLGQQAPPHDIITTIKSSGASKLFTLFYQGNFYPELQIQLSLNAISVSFLTVSILSLLMLLFSFIKKAPAILSFIIVVLFVFSSYLSLILSIQ